MNSEGARNDNVERESALSSVKDVIHSEYT